MRLFDVQERELEVGDYVAYVTKSEAPSIQFAYLDEFKEKDRAYGNPDYTNLRVKITHADKYGNRLTKTRTEYHPEAPEGQRVITVDTGKPSSVWLDEGSYRSHDVMSSRLLKVNPI